MVELIKELKTLDGDTIIGFFVCLITYITLSGIAAIVRNIGKDKD